MQFHENGERESSIDSSKSTLPTLARSESKDIQYQVAKEQQPITFPPTSAQAQEQLQRAWNETRTDYPRESTLAQVFEAQVQAHPAAIAVIDERGHEISYTELNQRANALAAFLREQGIDTEDTIGLLAGRSLALLIGFLGIVKAGAAYVPLDPSHPDERLQFMLSNAHASLLLTQQPERLPQWSGRSFLLDTFVAPPATPIPNPPQHTGPLHLACVLYTSGSTGQAKGIGITQRGILRLVLRTNYVHFTPQATVLHLSNISFDVTTYEVWGALLNGARLRVVPQSVVLDPGAFYRLVQQQQEVIAFLTTALFNYLAPIIPEMFPHFAHLSVGGEALDPITSYRIQQQYAPRQLIGMYGPAENATASTTYDLRGLKPEDTTVPVGTPIANSEAYVLDAQMRPLPPGQLGELYVGGDGLSRGYVNRPELTAQTFLPHPFSQQPGARLYKTGDLARYRPDGVIEFAGRIDDQVKIRGFRIEPGEIAVVLKREAAVVRDAFVLARTIQGSKQLVAYVVPQDGQQRSAEQLREALQLHLPPYMVPAFFVFLPALPLTPNGKVDRQALPEPEEARGSLEDDEHWTPVQRQLAAIWREVLHIHQFGLHNNFFALGGQSLLGIQLISRITNTFHCQVPIQVLFTSPTIDALAQVITARLIDATPISGSGIVRVEQRPAPLPLSFAQEQLWFQEQLHPDSSAYTIPCILSLRGQLDIAVLTRCWQILFARHEALRTTFEKIDGKPVQNILPPSASPLPYLDLSGMSEEERQAACEEAIEQTTNWHFDLQGSLVRLCLVRLRPQEHLLCCAFHHSIFDGWSLQIVLRELARCYQQLLSGHDPELPPLAVQPADHALWQRTPAYSERVRPQLEYWQRLLSGAPEVITLATDFPRPAQQSFRGARYYYTIPKSLMVRLREHSQQQAVTLSMSLFALFAMLLASYSRQDDLVIGTPLAGRSEMELEPLVGFFVNMLALRVRLDDQPSFHTLLEQVHTLFLDAFTHQDVPFEQVVEAVQPRRNLSFHPLFQVSFAFQPYQIPSSLGPVDMQQLALPIATSQFDLTLFIDEHADGSLNGCWEYNTDLFKSSTIEQLHARFLRLIENALAHPDHPFARLSLLSDVERQQMLYAWNETRSDYPRDSTLAQVFEAQVQAHPAAVAVIDEHGHEISYGELNQRANALAAFLHAQGIRSEETVGLLAERSLALLIGFLGVVKAGAAYVPLDPSYPDERLRFMLSNARVALLLTRDPERDLQWSGLSFSLDACVKSPSEPVPNPLQRTEPLNLACVIYTSGSTGQAKGIGITQRGILRLARETSYFHITPQSTMMHLSSTSFDATTYEVWGALLNGARLCIVPQPVVLDPTAFARLIQQQREVMMVLTTALFNYLARAIPEMFSHLAHLTVGGEALDPLISYRIQQEYTPRQFFCLYGPAENTTASTFYDISGLEPEATTVAIGTPITNSEAYVLDPELRLVPPGLLGELYVGGDGLARGYLHRPELTAQAFMPHPFSQQPGARLYKTGDLARYRPDGVIEFAGRVDDQVKIRGFRIEPGEIEVAIKREEGVRDAFVLARTIQDNKQLVAYVVPQDGPSCSAEQLRTALQQHLPPYMVPAFFVFLPALPINSNGKLDRQALPEPDTTTSPLQEQESWTPVERELATIWKEVLHIHQLGLHDNFFALGGQSLLGIQLMSRVAKAFHCEAPIRLLFASPTIAELAQAITPRLTDATYLSTSAKSRDEQRPELLPLSFAQEQLWFLEQLHPEESTYTIPCVLSLRGKLDVAVLTRCWQILFARHEALRTVFLEVDGKPVQRILPPSEVVIPYLDLSHMGEQERQAAREEAIKQTITWHFDLQRSLVRLRLVRLRPEEHLLCCSFHHGIFDGWSLQIVLSELARCYQQLLSGHDPELPPLARQPADYALWQRTPAYHERVQPQLEYWQRLLTGSPEVITLATDFPRPAQQLSHGDAYYCSFPPRLINRLREQNQQPSVTLSMSLFTLFAMLLAHYSRQDDLVIGTALAGRTEMELEPLVGLFANVLPLRVRLDDQPSFHTLLERVHALFLDGFTHQDVPFEQIVEAVQPRRSLSFHPLFQVSFAFQPYQIPSSLGPVDVQQLPARTATSQFDITLFIDEHADGSLSGNWEYNTNLFKASTIEQMHARFLQIIESALEHPDRAFSRLNLLSDVERQQILHSWNETRTDYPRESTLAQVFEAQVQAHPAAIAIIDEHGHEISYDELNQRANALAAFLGEQGIGTEDTIGLLAERSLALLVGFLSIVKVGAVYVPLDPSYPDERLRFMLSNARIALLLTRDPERDLQWSGPSYSLDAFVESPLSSVPDPLRHSGPLNLACIHYTSGSTGQAKGIGVTQQSILRLVLQTNFVHITPQATLLHLSNTSFDATTYEVWGALLNGARVCIVPQSVVLDPATFARLVGQQREVITFLTTALFNYLARTVPEMFRHLAHLTVGGEALDPDLTYMVRQEYSPRQFLAMYGPTENTTASTTYDLRGLGPEATTVAIGTPIANSEAYVLDPELRLVPPGLLGELYVGGDGLARGYLHRPELTAQAFVPHPFSQQPGARLYKTGDLARYRPDGVIEFAGRVDDQVKIRGFRIEPGEIEVVLKREESVRDAFVLARSIQGSKQLVAYVVLKESQQRSTEQLRTALQQHLPPYMVPAFFVFLPALPMNSNGKIDRQRLPAPEETTQSQVEEENWTPVQRELAAIWKEVLHIHQVGLNDDFFSMGGHSLLITQMTSRIRQHWQIQIPLRLLFEEPTIEGLARHIVSLQTEQATEQHTYQDAAIPIQQREDENLEDLLALFEGMSDEEASALLHQQESEI
ncbi:hypothetical protein KDH_23810 [Dictyobacter sp. S3.2.2.5]|uniref:Carrier domain-containing protein n=1 Tax=Dictyobacter halimunensis TaxID=3026934 RepID=A0ABQ6FT09_9CHLR|nr:hypothetical protein KDH_23810 [Dictyobacter sp. S3.2.2.5]